MLIGSSSVCSVMLRIILQNYQRSSFEKHDPVAKLGFDCSSPLAMPASATIDVGSLERIAIARKSPQTLPSPCIGQLARGGDNVSFH